MSILSIDLHTSKSTIRLSFHFQNVTYESLDDICCSKFSTGCNSHVLGWRPQSCVSSLQLDVGCLSLAGHEPGFESHRAYLGHVRPSYTCSGTSCAKIRQLEAALHREWQQLSQHDIRRLTGGLRHRIEAVIQARESCERKSQLRFGGRRLLLLNDEAWRCHPYAQAS
jgi:hypothetical protein